MPQDPLFRVLALPIASIILGLLFALAIEVIRPRAYGGYEFRRDGELVTLAIIGLVYVALRLIRYDFTGPHQERAQVESDQDATRT